MAANRVPTHEKPMVPKSRSASINSALSKSSLGARFRADPLKAFFELTQFWRHKDTIPPELNARDRTQSTWTKVS
jgi:hypothetical protein